MYDVRTLSYQHVLMSGQRNVGCILYIQLHKCNCVFGLIKSISDFEVVATIMLVLTDIFSTVSAQLSRACCMLVSSSG